MKAVPLGRFLGIVRHNDTWATRSDRPRIRSNDTWAGRDTPSTRRTLGFRSVPGTRVSCRGEAGADIHRGTGSEAGAPEAPHCDWSSTAARCVRIKRPL